MSEGARGSFWLAVTAAESLGLRNISITPWYQGPIVRCRNSRWVVVTAMTSQSCQRPLLGNVAIKFSTAASRRLGPSRVEPSSKGFGRELPSYESLIKLAFAHIRRHRSGELWQTVPWVEASRKCRRTSSSSWLCSSLWHRPLDGWGSSRWCAVLVGAFENASSFATAALMHAPH